MGTSLQGTVALVTGASSGIGEATARELAMRGAAVAVLARRTDRLKALAERIEQAGGTAVVIEADVTDPEQVHAAVERTVQTWGRLDILINNAGVARPKSIADATVEDLEFVVRVNLLGSLYCAHAALPHLLRAAETAERKVADLVNISSLSGRNYRKGSSVYTATKHAVNAYSECLRKEVASSNVRVSVVEPARVETELFPPEVWNSHRTTDQDATPPLRPEDVADAIGYAVSRPAHVALSDLLIRPARLER
ncbi:SDR family oxidoreductase [Actinospica sp.]|uniref:SDR family oxidoreductase n=1 Tax=Actinospica sp. TaxID=1872142 RepID=UPI002CE66E75|nr:SDR family oxidoreductase [Actinospica sp.]HWG25563.1 SDR family oxidoreductase [Actinospica sp.]